MIAISDYIKLHRSFLEWEWYTDNNTKIVFLHLLLKANWKDGYYKGKPVKRGQCISSPGKIAESTELTDSEVKTAIKHLKMTNEIASKGTNKYTVFTIKNYDKYQSVSQQNDNQIDNSSPPISEPLSTIEEREEVEEGKNDTTGDRAPYKEVAALYKLICVSYPKIRTLSESRKKAIRARAKKYSLDDFRQLFEEAERSEFLKGSNKNNWSADFDWLIADDNMAKVLEGKYREKQKSTSHHKQSKDKFNNFEGRDYDMGNLERKLLNSN